MGIKVFNCFGLVGEDERDLSAISITSLDAQKHKAFVIVDNNPMVFEWDATGDQVTNVSEHPFAVRPNDFATAGVWREKTRTLFGTTDPPDIPGLSDGTLYYLYE